jgi:hypothetical protein
MNGATTATTKTTVDLKRLSFVLSVSWTWLDAALRDGTDLPDQLREALHHARVAPNTCGEQLYAHIVSSETEG